VLNIDNRLNERFKQVRRPVAIDIDVSQRGLVMHTQHSAISIDPLSLHLSSIGV